MNGSNVGLRQLYNYNSQWGVLLFGQSRYYPYSYK